jgi:MFS family permease
VLKLAIFNRFEIDKKTAIVNIIILVNTFTWYFYAFNILREITLAADVSLNESLLIWGINFAGMATAALSGATLLDRVKNRKNFFLLWFLAGALISLTPLAGNMMNSSNIIVLSALFGLYFGLGMPACMGYFAESTASENRARLAGMIFLLIGVGFFLLGSISVESVTTYALILGGWRGLGFLILLLLGISEKTVEKRRPVKYINILSSRPFFLYFVPWLMFSLINSLAAPVIGNFFEGGVDFVRFSSIIENVLAGAFAVIGGFFADFFGRKRLAIIGFSMLGVGYAAIGFSSRTMVGWWLYTVVDGIAWGAFGTLFLLTLWGDFAHDQRSDRYYAIGALPFLFSNFIGLTIGTYVANNITATETVFSVAAFFLFLAVLPLVYAPETLPEKTIKDRELKSYLDKAQKVREKYS